MNDEIIALFRKNANQRVAEGQSAYVRNQFEFIGIKTPDRRRIQKDFLEKLSEEKKIDWDFVWEMWNLPEREFQYLAIDYLKKMKKALSAKDLPKIRQLATTKSWWETVDSLDELVGSILQADYATDGSVSAYATICQWSKDENFWVRRLAIDCQLTFKEKTDIDLLTTVISVNLAGSKFEKEFFINKAIGWALRDFSKTNALWVKKFIEKNREKMNNLSIREASKYL